MARSMTVCLQPGCPQLVERGWCPNHRPRRNRRRDRQVYDTAAWQRVRTRYRSRHPHCHVCGAPTEDVDHVIPRRILVAAGINNPDHDRWLQPLCHRHHSEKTQHVDRPLLAAYTAGASPQALAERAIADAATWASSRNGTDSAQSRPDPNDPRQTQGYHP